MQRNLQRTTAPSRSTATHATQAAMLASILPEVGSLGAYVISGIIMLTIAFTLLRIPYLIVRRWLRKRPRRLRLRWRSAPETFHAEAHHWALASALVYSVRNENAWDSLALDSPVEETRRSIRRSWGIDDRASLLLALRDLFLQGHREDLQAIVGHAAGLPGEAFKEACAKLHAYGDDEQRELLWQMQVTRDNVDGIQAVNFLAWDMVRFVMLCQNGLRLGLIDETEARDFVLLPSLYLQYAYRSWLDCADQFMRARAFWAGGDPAMRSSQDEIRRTIDLLQRDQHSPWKLLAWNLALPRPKGLFAQALLQAQLIAPPEDNDHAIANPFAQALTDMLAQSASVNAHRGR